MIVAADARHLNFKPVKKILPDTQCQVTPGVYNSTTVQIFDSIHKH
jgi:hypothetical protein